LKMKKDFSYLDDDCDFDQQAYDDAMNDKCDTMKGN